MPAPIAPAPITAACSIESASTGAPSDSGTFLAASLKKNRRTSSRVTGFWPSRALASRTWARLFVVRVTDAVAKDFDDLERSRIVSVRGVRELVASPARARAS